MMTVSATAITVKYVQNVTMKTMTNHPHDISKKSENVNTSAEHIKAVNIPDTKLAGAVDELTPAQVIFYMLDEAMRRTDLNAAGEFGFSGKTFWRHDALDQRIDEYIDRLLASARSDWVKEVVGKLPKKLDTEVSGEPSLLQGTGGTSAPFYCSVCYMGEMEIMERVEGDKYYCKCSYWSDPHNAYIDKSGGAWLGWKDKAEAQKAQDELPLYENGYNQALADCKEVLQSDE